MKKKLFKKIAKRCVALCRLFSIYRKRVRAIETELGGCLETC
ncbi:MAG: hypothetical protein V1882_09740 [Candidatus Omnitrophota bacterium]